MAVTLESLIGQLKFNNKEQEETTGAVKSTNLLLVEFIKDQKYQRLKDIENQREMMKKIASGGTGMGLSGPKESTSDKQKKAGFALPEWAKGVLGGLGLAGLAGMMGTILKRLGFLAAGLAALELASQGLRGWEAGALKKLKGLTSGPKAIASRIATYIDDVVRAGLKFIGISEDVMGTSKKGNPYLKMKQGPDGKFLGKELASTKEMMKRLFGMGDDAADAGKGAGSMFAKIRDIIGRLFTPLVRFIDSAVDVGKTFFAPFAAVGKFLGVTTLAGLSALGITKFAPLVGKILLPLGILFSAFEAVSSWTNDPENANRSTDEKVMNTISTFIGNFIGAPLDLLKGGITWLMKKAFGLEVDKDGKILPDQGIGGLMAEKIQSFSFEEFIKDLFNNTYSIIKAIFTEIISFVKDPATYVKEAYDNILKEEGVDSFGELVTSKARGLYDALFGWIPSYEDMKEGMLSVARAIVPDFAHDFMGLSETSSVNENNSPNPAELAAAAEGDKRAQAFRKFMVENASAFDKDGNMIIDAQEFKSMFSKKMDKRFTGDISLRDVISDIGINNGYDQDAAINRLIKTLEASSENGGGINIATSNNSNDTSLLAIASETGNEASLGNIFKFK